MNQPRRGAAMGAFFTSLHVFVPGRGEAPSEASAVLEGDARSLGLRPADPDETPDRQVLLRASPRWLSVYDSDTEQPDERALGRMVAALSTALDTSVFWVLVHDSRVLRLGLYVKGQYRDLYDSNPAWFQGSGAERGRPEAHLRAWRHLLAPGQPEERLRGVFAREDRFPEDALPVLAEVLGVPPGRLSSGFRYLQAEGIGPGATHLAWCRATRSEEAAAGGEPRLETPGAHLARLYGTTPPPAAVLEATAGEAVRLGATALNRGGPGRGLAVEVHGGDPVVRWGRVRLVLGDPRAGLTVDALLVEDGDHQVARFPGAALPPGGPGQRLPADPAAALAALEARLATCVHANVQGSAREPGRAPVQVRLVPVHGTATTVHAEVVVKAAGERPPPAPSVTIEREAAVLASRSCLAVLVVLEVERAEERAGEVVGRLRGIVPQEGEVRTTRYPAPGRGRPQVVTSPAAGFLDGPGWNDLLAAVTTGCAKVDAEWFDGPASVEPSVRIAYGMGIAPPEDPLPVLSIGMRRGDLDGAEGALSEVFDDLARAAGLVQAFLTRWGELLDLEVTPWEVAAGVHGQCTLGRAWATRWLRGLGSGQVWLGPDLLDHLDAVAVAGEVPATGLGPSLRVEVHRVEPAARALEAVLPDAAAWRRAVSRR